MGCFPETEIDPNIHQLTQTSTQTLPQGTQRRFPPKYIENIFQAIQSTFTSLEMHFQ